MRTPKSQACCANLNDFWVPINGAGAVGYLSESGEIKLIEVTYFGETGKTYFEFYFSKNDPFFIFEKEFKYNTHFMMTEELVKDLNNEDGVKHEAFDLKKTKVEEWRYYFDKGKVIKTIGPKGILVTDSNNAKSALEISLSNHARFSNKIQSTPKSGKAD